MAHFPPREIELTAQQKRLRSKICYDPQFRQVIDRRTTAEVFESVKLTNWLGLDKRAKKYQRK